MRLDYFFLFKCGITVLIVLIVFGWLPAGWASVLQSLPAPSHSPEYNRFAWVLIGIGVWGLYRLMNRR